MAEGQGLWQTGGRGGGKIMVGEADLFGYLISNKRGNPPLGGEKRWGEICRACTFSKEATLDEKPTRAFTGSRSLKQEVRSATLKGIRGQP